MKFYAHTAKDAQGNPSPKEHWEPLFTPDCDTLEGKACAKCVALDRYHGHLNKVAHLCSEFAAKMFPPGPDRESARQWGHLTGLWHDLGKFAPEWQIYLASKADPHQADATGTTDHSIAGAQHVVHGRAD